MKLMDKLSALRREKHKMRLFASRALLRTGMCKLFEIPLPEGPRLRFHPTEVSATLWVHPRSYCGDAAFVGSRLRPGDTYIDVGANIGHLALIGAQAVGPSGRVIAIEPHPRTFRYLRDNVVRNQFANVTLLNAAVGACQGTAFVSSLRNDDMNHVQANSGLPVPMITLDSLPIHGRIALLKTDTEGYEPFVLEGARQLLPRVDCVYFECSEWNLNRYGKNSRELRSILEEFGFAISKLMPNGSMKAITGDYDASGGGNLVACQGQPSY